jgi:predicted nucleotide-binding protein
VSISKELFIFANELSEFDHIDAPELDKLIETANEFGNSWSGSWFGYHSRVYYFEFKMPPPGAAFSQEWGLKDSFSMGSRGDWREYNFDDVVQLIHDRAGNPKVDKYFTAGENVQEKFDEIKLAALSVIYSNFDSKKDKFLEGLIDKIEKLKIFTDSDFVDYQRPSGKMMSRDMIAIEKGLVTPPHIAVTAKYFSVKQPYESCKDLKKNIIKLANHLRNMEKKNIIEDRIGTNIFIGHGRSHHWRELKDFVSDRLALPWDEFNRVPVAGVTNITRLSQMLDQSCIAFLVMTAEDELADGDLHARMNVVHEVGLFQGRLGFERAIVLLEEGCEEFSNIQGLGQIRFPKGNISAIFEDIRQVLEREGIVE